MRTTELRFALALALTTTIAPAAALAGEGDVSRINRSIAIEDGARAGGLETVNGAIRVGENAVVGEVETVNGGVKLGRGTHAASVETVNGGVMLHEDTTVSGDVEAVNGGIYLSRNAEVVGDLGNVNGEIELHAARVGGEIETTSGDILVLEGSRIARGIHVEEPKGVFHGTQNRDPRVVIGAGAVVEGELVFDRKVELHVHASAKVGTIRGATAQRYDGADPDFD